MFQADYSTVVLAEDGELLGARLATDEQWRFPVADSLPEKFMKAITTKEDRYFRYHPGVNPVSVFRALWQNLKDGKVVSGASTLSMQVIRLSRGNPPRTVGEKLYEMLLATRLELAFSKDEILRLYAAHAPFGGNVVGFETASWRYYNRDPFQLSWAECASLAVLPNAPGLIHPGRNRKSLLDKRNQLLRDLYEQELIDEDTYQLGLLERVPDEPVALPQAALHLTERLHQQKGQGRYRTLLDFDLQQKAQQTVDDHLKELRSNHIHNGSLLLIDNHTGAVKAYVGNGSDGVDFYNDMISTPRSSGSILKPFLYASMLSSGELMPSELVADIPTFLGDFRPQNFVNDFEGAVPADEALARSLNIPAVLELQQYSVERFHQKLKELGFTTVNRSPANYGLSLILGGAEVTPWDLGRAYYRMAASLSTYPEAVEMEDLKVTAEVKAKEKSLPLNQGAVFETFKVLTTVNRPDSEMGWKRFGNPNIAWKTGTSFGYRDAWAVGVTPAYTCVVWVGNADGEGRPGLIGAQAAGPLLFDFLNDLPQSGWFNTPWDEMVKLNICPQSGQLAGRDCPGAEKLFIPATANTAEICEYHKTIYTDVNRNYRLAVGCADEGDMVSFPYFILPPAQAWFYAKKHAGYEQLPSWKPGCGGEDQHMVDVIYPKPGGRIFIPRELDGQSSKVIMEVAHRSPEQKVFWHLNGEYLGETQIFHQMALKLEKGDYHLLVEDEKGNLTTRNFSVVEK